MAKIFEGGSTVKHLKFVVMPFFLLILAACGSVTPTPELSPLGTTPAVYGGRAVALEAKALLLSAKFADTGALLNKGDALNATLVTAAVPGILNAGVLHAATVGQGDRTLSEASVAGLELSVPGLSVKAAFIASEAATVCDKSNKAAVSGSSELVGLSVNGKAVSVTGGVNQTINLLGIGKIVINEQSGTASGNQGSKKVTALHITTLVGVDVALASSEAAMTCQVVRPTYGDYVTGSGTIKTDCASSCGSFSLSAGYRNSKLWGGLTYIDSAKNLTIRSAGITAYSAVNSTTRLVKGKATVNGKSGFKFEVKVADNGKGTSDTFEIKVFDSANKLTYTASGKLICGNVTLHKGPIPCTCTK